MLCIFDFSERDHNPTAFSPYAWQEILPNTPARIEKTDIFFRIFLKSRNLSIP